LQEINVSQMPTAVLNSPLIPEKEVDSYVLISRYFVAAATDRDENNQRVSIKESLRQVDFAHWDLSGVPFRNFSRKKKQAESESCLK
jgi:hypothetical protein